MELFLNRERVIPTAQFPSVNGEAHASEVTSSDRNNPMLGITEELPN